MPTIRLPAALASLPEAKTFVAGQARAAGLPPRKVAQIELALEEALMNICHHAYRNGAGEVEVRCMQDEQQCLCIEVIDTGVPFDVLTVPAPDCTADLASRTVGGLGVFLLRAMAEEVTYRRHNDQNVLRLVVSAPPEGPSRGCDHIRSA